MAISKHSRKAVDDFFAAIEPIAHAYRNNSFTFLAVKNSTQFTLIQGALFLVVPSSFPFSILPRPMFSPVIIR